MHCRARADRTEAQAQMPRSRGYLGVSTGSTSGDSEDQIHSLTRKLPKDRDSPHFIYLTYLKHPEEFLAHCQASINICGMSQVRKQGSAFYML